jgi:hypothetical protein
LRKGNGEDRKKKEQQGANAFHGALLILDFDRGAVGRGRKDERIITAMASLVTSFGIPELM